MSVIRVSSRAYEEIIDITADIAAAVGSTGAGVCTIFTTHTTCALTILATRGASGRTF